MVVQHQLSLSRTLLLNLTKLELLPRVYKKRTLSFFFFSSVTSQPLSFTILLPAHLTLFCINYRENKNPFCFVIGRELWPEFSRRNFQGDWHPAAVAVAPAFLFNYIPSDFFKNPFNSNYFFFHFLSFSSFSYHYFFPLFRGLCFHIAYTFSFVCLNKHWLEDLLEMGKHSDLIWLDTSKKKNA